MFENYLFPRKSFEILVLIGVLFMIKRTLPEFSRIGSTNFLFARNQYTAVDFYITLSSVDLYGLL